MLSKYSAFYNELFNCLIISFNNNEVKENISRQNGTEIILLDENKKTVGINIFKASEKIKDLILGYNPYNKNIIEYINKNYEIDFETQFKIGKIITCKPIENSHLHLCKVEFDNQNIEQIVCGAKNAKVNLIVIAATIGTMMPNGQLIIPGKLKGVDSNGMLCNAKELNLANTNFNQEGIVELNDAFANHLGRNFWEVYYSEKI